MVTPHYLPVNPETASWKVMLMKSRLVGCLQFIWTYAAITNEFSTIEEMPGVWIINNEHCSMIKQ